MSIEMIEGEGCEAAGSEMSKATRKARNYAETKRQVFAFLFLCAPNDKMFTYRSLYVTFEPY